jgi:hypothetical protein
MNRWAADIGSGMKAEVLEWLLFEWAKDRT